jgi:hypothetical protein
MKLKQTSNSIKAILLKALKHNLKEMDMAEIFC